MNNYTIICIRIHVRICKIDKNSNNYKSLYTKYNYTYLCKSIFQYCGLYISETYKFTSITIF